MTRLPAKHPMLRNVIKYYWELSSDSILDINHMLLPVTNIDLIINVSSPITYTTSKGVERNHKGFHFNGIHNEHYMLRQSGKLRVIGISFQPLGMYSLLKVPISEFTNHTVEADSVIREFSNRIGGKISNLDSFDETVLEIEEELLKMIDFSLSPSSEILKICSSFGHSGASINDFCNSYGINQRRLERIFKKYTGVSPKLYNRIDRFQHIRKILGKTDESLTNIAFDNFYYDQNHFIKDFKKFTGSSPGEFINSKKAILQLSEK